MMRVIRVSAYRQFQPFVDVSYSTSGGSASGFDSVIVAIDTDEGITGWGEMAPLGSFYAPAFAGGARAGIAELAPHLLGEDPTRHRQIVRLMDAVMRGHPYVKSALDMACWDAAAAYRGEPLCELLGGRFGDAVPIYRPLTLGTPEAMAELAGKYLAQGHGQLQVKVGQDSGLDADRLAAVERVVGREAVLVADANGGWTTAEARRFLWATRDIDYTLEQPCATYEDCRTIRRHCPRPLVLDESIESLHALLHAYQDGVADGVTVKIARVGGVTRAAMIRDVAVELGIEVGVEDTGGASIDTAAILHLSLSTPEPLRRHTIEFSSWVTVDNADGVPTMHGGRLAAPIGPGLGIAVRSKDLGKPFFEISEATRTRKMTAARPSHLSSPAEPDHGGGHISEAHPGSLDS